MTNTIRLLAPIICLLAFTVSAKADVILLVDVSNPSSVTFTATNAPSQASVSGDMNRGITLLNFFSATFTFEESITGNLRPAITGSGGSYDFGQNNLGALTETELNFFRGGALGNTQDFVSGQLALIGSTSIDSFFELAPLPQIGATGDIVNGDSPSSGVVIGQWRAVPEPSSLLIGLFGVVGLCHFRRRSSAT